MGIMGQLQMAVGEGVDPEEAVERMILAAEGRLDTDETSGMDVGEDSALGDSVVRPAPGHSDVGMRPVSEAAQPKPKLDLDLYDPDNDDL
jgi:hypothetical protein